VKRFHTALMSVSHPDPVLSRSSNVDTSESE